MIKPGKGTHCEKLLKALENGKVTTTSAFINLHIASFHRRLTDLRNMGYVIEQQRVQKLDERGKEIEHWNEYWIRRTA